MKKLVLTAIVLLSIVLTSCWYNHKWEDMHPKGQASGPPAPCDTAGVISYSATIQPIMNTNCATTSSCHVSHGGALDYSNYGNVASDAQAAYPNDIMTRIDMPTTNGKHMPKDLGFMNACDTLKIRKWIKAGCLNN